MSETTPEYNAKLFLSGDNRGPCPACLEKDTELMIRRMEVKNGAVEIDAAVAQHVLVGIAGCALRMLGNAANYVEMQMAVAERARTLEDERPLVAILTRWLEQGQTDDGIAIDHHGKLLLSKVIREIPNDTVPHVGAK